MALKLGIPKEPYWLTLGYGVRVKVRPCTTPIYNAAVQWAAVQYRETLDAKDTLEDIGAEIVAMPDLSTEAGQKAYRNFCFVRFLARSSIVEWEGVMNEAGDVPADVTPENIDRLMEFHRIAEDFVEAFTGPVVSRIVEGNASAPLPGGISAEGAKHAPVVH